MKIYKGIIKKLPTEEQIEKHQNGERKLYDVQLVETIESIKLEGKVQEVLPIRLSYQEMDSNGNEKYTFDVQTEIYMKSIRQTPVLHAVDKELRILLDLGEFTPVKVVVSELEEDGKVINKIECIQNQHCGLE